MRGLTNSVIIFMVGALAGPLINWATSPPYRWPSVGGFSVYLVLLLWPTQPLGVIEYSSGTLVATLVTVGANVIFFGLIGLAVGAALSRTIAFLGIYLLVAALIFLLALWASGFDLHQVDAVALVAALGFYAFLFRLSARFARAGSS